MDWDLDQGEESAERAWTEQRFKERARVVWKRNMEEALQKTLQELAGAEGSTPAVLRREVFLSSATRLAFAAFPRQPSEKVRLDHRVDTAVKRAFGCPWCNPSFMAWKAMNASVFVGDHPAFRDVQNDANSGSLDLPLSSVRTHGLWRRTRIPDFSYQPYMVLLKHRAAQVGEGIFAGLVAAQVPPASSLELDAHYVSDFVHDHFRCEFCTGYVDSRLLFCFESPRDANTKVGCALGGVWLF